ncbi:DoxX family protein [Mycobacterium intracellulare]|uniref:DoxX family protein n=1 Tax=Mycobacterium intracellulare TaxID=1767 RepID=A0A7R7MSQ9_MYCIT|nr:DoxX family protein [Mycobacterium intracellulare]ASW88138.1 DoxX family protein [Mycobacterium intracellulare]ASW98130.1 DoxX family protein [Mycobacterium intracellulare]MEE3804791.1 DoxX family protein [Mycobacterium intracellulare]OBG15423.1 DoxX family protein [Mycobacterium intracellulare]PBA23285.1 DoxX family protein [Mycobacterium intracellulare]
MNIALWAVQGLLAFAYLVAGGLKVVRPREQLVASGRLDWMKDHSDAAVKAVGAVEIVGALGVILPEATGIARILTPIAAVGLVIVQIGAMRVHLTCNEREPLPINVILLLLAAFVAVGRSVS